MTYLCKTQTSTNHLTQPLSSLPFLHILFFQFFVTTIVLSSDLAETSKLLKTTKLWENSTLRSTFFWAQSHFGFYFLQMYVFVQKIKEIYKMRSQASIVTLIPFLNYIFFYKNHIFFPVHHHRQVINNEPTPKIDELLTTEIRRII